MILVIVEKGLTGGIYVKSVIVSPLNPSSCLGRAALQPATIIQNFASCIRDIYNPYADRVIAHIREAK
jgi:hypothetical protein